MSTPCSPNPCGDSRRCVVCTDSCQEGFVCTDSDDSGGVGLVLLWRRKSDALTLTIQGEQRERYTYQSYYKRTSLDFSSERRRSKRRGSYNPTFEMHKKMTNMFLPFPEELLETDLRSSVMVDPTTDVDPDDDTLEDGFLNDETTTHVTYSTEEPVVQNVKLLNQSVVPSVSAYENLAVDDDIDINQEDFMTKENFQELERKRFSVIKKWTSSNKGVLEITPDFDS
ncbi:uncharacterized protein [Dysidea avara]|uniref:uncharacterized protein isoform X2 n=1 Tax=Dysidea avara TaxID=196820 RepID=UPI0033203433